jgi:peptidoglycan/LPS O-acetylase OafA/YrhL
MKIEPPLMPHIPSLDGLRAISFLVVFLAHAAPRSRLIPGDLGVTVFFFLSGFLITTLMRSEFERNGAVNVGHFYLRRALRILPPFYLVWLVAHLVALCIFPPGTLYGPTMIAQLLFVSNYEGIYGLNREAPGTGVLWSLAVEEHFYLLFPWLYLAMQRWRLSGPRQASLLWGLCVLVLLWRVVLTFKFHAGPGHIYIASDTRVDSILFGCALAVWGNSVFDKPFGTPNVWIYALLPAAVTILLMTFTSRNLVFQQTWYFTAEGVALTLLFTAAIRFHSWPLFQWLNSRPVAFVGMLSYSLYLTHFLMLRVVGQLWPQGNPAARAAIALLISFIGAWAIYSAVEKPCARVRKRLIDA